MIVKQIYTQCLSEASYFIASKGEAAVIDPIRDLDQYFALLKEHDVKLKYVIETHFHADFVSGHLDLSNQTGAPIIYGPKAETEFEIINAKDGEEFVIGDLKLKALHSPGHTPESTCYLLFDGTGKEHCIFTGDTLFVGDVGRPDLMGGKHTKEELAKHMYNTLNTIIKPLADNVIVYPAHGAGSSCGKSLGSETFSTIGEQKQSNYALQKMTEDEFVKAICEGLASPPKYFPINAKINKTGYSPIDDVIQKSFTALTTDDIMANSKAVLLDVRTPDEFELGFINNSINIGLNGRFAEWAGKLISFDEPIIIISNNESDAKEAIVRLARVGFENVIGYLMGGFNSWKKLELPFDMVISIDAYEFSLDVKHETKINIVDVRNDGEFEEGHVLNASNFPLHNLQEKPLDVDSDKSIYVHCLSGYRSMIAASILKKLGYGNIKNISGGWKALIETDITTVIPQPV